jgi:hypothetical protein
MKIRNTTDGTHEEDHDAIEALRRDLTSRLPSDPADDDPYWQTLLVESNRRLDEATSGKAISISWAARVAIPGVVAIIFFFIGLHYYSPDEPPPSSFAEALRTIPAEVQDSLVVETSLGDESAGSDMLSPAVFGLSASDIEEYLIARGIQLDTLGTFSHEEIQSVVGMLGGSL